MGRDFNVLGAILASPIYNLPKIQERPKDVPMCENPISCRNCIIHMVSGVQGAQNRIPFHGAMERHDDAELFCVM